MLDHITKIDTLIGICALLAVLAFYAYSSRLRNKIDVLNASGSDDLKEKIFREFNIPTDNISGKDAAKIVTKQIEGRLSTTKWIIIASVVVLIIAAIIPIVSSIIREPDDLACKDSLDMAIDEHAAGNYSVAGAYLEDIYEDQDCGYTRYRAGLYLGMGAYLQNEYEKAIEWYGKSLEIARSRPEREERVEMRLYSSLGYAYEALENWNEALGYHQKSRGVAAQDSDLYVQATMSIARVTYAIFMTGKNPVKLKIAKAETSYILSTNETQLTFPYINQACFAAHEGNLEKFEKYALLSIKSLSGFPPGNERKLARVRGYVKEYLLGQENWKYIHTFPYNCPPIIVAIENCDCKDDMLAEFENLAF